jgi:hypothetical protein
MTKLTLHYDFAGDASLSARVGPTLGITRATTATFVDHEGLIRTAASGEARFTGARRVENLCLQSEDLGTTWTPVSETAIDTNVAVAPDGTTTADKLGDDGSTGTGNAKVVQNVTVSAAANCLSVFAKADGVDWVLLQDQGSSPIPAVYFDLTNGVKGTASNVTSSGIDDYGNGWFRCWMVYTSSDTSAQPNIWVADGDEDVVIDLDGTSSILVWGAQLENVSGQADTSPSGYIPTTTAAVAATYPVTGESLGLLVEEARTNLCLQSEDLRTTWSGINVRDNVDTVNVAVAPDGTTTADRIIDNSATGSDVSGYSQNITFSATTAYTYSVFLKEEQLDWAFIEVINLTGLTINKYFDLGNGVEGGAEGADVDSTFIEDYGNGWYRCGLTFTTAADTSGTVRVFSATSNGVAAVDLDGTSSVLFWGAQVEAGAFPTSYIPTTTGSVARNADVVQTTTIDWFNAAAGTIYVKALLDNVSADFARYLEINDGGASERYSIWIQSQDTNFAVTDGIGQAQLVTSQTHAAGDTVIAAASYAVDDFAQQRHTR